MTFVEGISSSKAQKGPQRDDFFFSMDEWKLVALNDRQPSEKRFDAFVSFHGSEITNQGHSDVRRDVATHLSNFLQKELVLSVFFDDSAIGPGQPILQNLFDGILGLRGGGTAFIVITATFFHSRWSVLEFTAFLKLFQHYQHGLEDAATARQILRTEVETNTVMDLFIIIFIQAVSVEEPEHLYTEFVKTFHEPLAHIKFRKVFESQANWRKNLEDEIEIHCKQRNLATVVGGLVKDTSEARLENHIASALFRRFQDKDLILHEKHARASLAHQLGIPNQETFADIIHQFRKTNPLSNIMNSLKILSETGTIPKEVVDTIGTFMKRFQWKWNGSWKDLKMPDLLPHFRDVWPWYCDVRKSKIRQPATHIPLSKITDNVRLLGIKRTQSEGTTQSSGDKAQTAAKVPRYDDDSCSGSEQPEGHKTGGRAEYGFGSLWRLHPFTNEEYRLSISLGHEVIIASLEAEIEIDPLDPWSWEWKIAVAYNTTPDNVLDIVTKVSKLVGVYNFTSSCVVRISEYEHDRRYLVSVVPKVSATADAENGLGEVLQGNDGTKIVNDAVLEKSLRDALANEYPITDDQYSQLNRLFVCAACGCYQRLDGNATSFCKLGHLRLLNEANRGLPLNKFCNTLEAMAKGHKSDLHLDGTLLHSQMNVVQSKAVNILSLISQMPKVYAREATMGILFGNVLDKLSELQRSILKYHEHGTCEYLSARSVRDHCYSSFYDFIGVSKMLYPEGAAAELRETLPFDVATWNQYFILHLNERLRKIPEMSLLDKFTLDNLPLMRKDFWYNEEKEKLVVNTIVNCRDFVSCFVFFGDEDVGKKTTIHQSIRPLLQKSIFKVVWCLDGSSSAALKVGTAELAKRLGIVLKATQLEQRLRSLKAALNNGERPWCIVIYDINVEKLLNRYCEALSSPNDGVVLCTTTKRPSEIVPGWAPLASTEPLATIRLGTRADGPKAVFVHIQFNYEDRMNALKNFEHDSAPGELADILHDPASISYATIYIKTENLTCSQYSELINSDPDPSSAAASFSLKKLIDAHPSSRELITLLTLLDRKKVPIIFLEGIWYHLFEGIPLRPLVDALTDCGLVRRLSSSISFSEKVQVVFGVVSSYDKRTWEHQALRARQLYEFFVDALKDDFMTDSDFHILVLRQIEHLIAWWQHRDRFSEQLLDLSQLAGKLYMKSTSQPKIASERFKLATDVARAIRNIHSKQADKASALQLAALYNQLGSANVAAWGENIYGRAAVAAYRQAYEWSLRGHDDDVTNSDVQKSLEALAHVLIETGNGAEAVDYLNRVLEAKKAAYGALSIEVAGVYLSLARANEHNRNSHTQFIQLAYTIISREESIPMSVENAKLLVSLAEHLLHINRLEQAKSITEVAIEMAISIDQPDCLAAATSVRGSVMGYLGNPQEQLECQQRAVNILVEKYGVDDCSWAITSAYYNLGIAYQAVALNTSQDTLQSIDFSESIRLLRLALRNSIETMAENNIRIGIASYGLGISLIYADSDLDEAKKLLLAAKANFSLWHGDDSGDTKAADEAIKYLIAKGDRHGANLVPKPPFLRRSRSVMDTSQVSHVFGFAESAWTVDVRSFLREAVQRFIKDPRITLKFSFDLSFPRLSLYFPKFKNPDEDIGTFGSSNLSL